MNAATRNLPQCEVCGAWEGDPCRTPNGSTRRPHEERERETTSGELEQ